MLNQREVFESCENSKQNTANNSQENLIEDLANVNSSSGNQSSVPIYKWSNERVLEWFSKKFPAYYETLLKDALIENRITGESLLDINHVSCLDQLKIFDPSLREQIVEEVALLKLRNEYEFIRRFKSQQTI